MPVSGVCTLECVCVEWCLLVRCVHYGVCLEGVCCIMCVSYALWCVCDECGVSVWGCGGCHGVCVAVMLCVVAVMVCVVAVMVCVVAVMVCEVAVMVCVVLCVWLL